MAIKLKVGKGKAVICLRPKREVETHRLLSDLNPEARATRDQANRERSMMRSRTLVIEYCLEHRLGYLWTLTYKGEGQHDWAAMTADVRRFEERWQADPVTAGVPYVLVPEWHPGGHGLHLHMGVGRFISWKVIRALWQDGGRHPLAGEIQTPRFAKGKVTPQTCARYLAKYVTKTLNDAGGTAGKGAHRFYKPHGMSITVRRWRFGSELEAYHHAIAFFGGELPHEWDSRYQEGWQGPRVVVLDWNRERQAAGEQEGRRSLDRPLREGG